MPWSISQLAQLAGTTIKAVRKYHEIDLLDDPPRKPNGSEQYEVSHLLRLLQITRLAELKVPLAAIAALDRSEGGADGSTPTPASDGDSTVSQLRRIGGELALTERYHAGSEPPHGSSDHASGPPGAVESLLAAFSSAFVDSALDELGRIDSETSPAPADIGIHSDAPDAPDADRARRDRLGELLDHAIGRRLAKPSPANDSDW